MNNFHLFLFWFYQAKYLCFQFIINLTVNLNEISDSCDRFILKWSDTFYVYFLLFYNIGIIFAFGFFHYIWYMTHKCLENLRNLSNQFPFYYSEQPTHFSKRHFEKYTHNPLVNIKYFEWQILNILNGYFLHFRLSWVWEKRLFLYIYIFLIKWFSFFYEQRLTVSAKVCSLQQ